MARTVPPLVANLSCHSLISLLASPVASGLCVCRWQAAACGGSRTSRMARMARPLPQGHRSGVRSWASVHKPQKTTAEASCTRTQDHIVSGHFKAGRAPAYPTPFRSVLPG